MKIFERIVKFEWDRGNFDKNYIKHKVTNQEAEEVFKNKPIIYFQDKKHSVSEKRHGVFGKTNRGRLLTIVFTLRNEKIRIITARDMSNKERRVYEQQNKTNT